MFSVFQLRTVVALVFVVSLIMVLSQNPLWTSASAEPPATAGEDAAVQESIRRALEGKPQSSSHDEPLLQDVLDLIKGQGSVLDGSLLDPDGETKSTPRTREKPDAYFRAAEALLKASRLLSALPNETDRDRNDLVYRMRQEAKRCLDVTSANSIER